MKISKSLVFTLPAILCACQDQKDEAPNILFIFSDDHATHAIRAYGPKHNNPELYKHVVTPAIDRLA